MAIFKKHVFVCTHGETCPEQGSQEVFSKLRKEMKERGLHDSIRINKAGCLGQCGNGPMLVIYPEATWYCKVQHQDCNEIIESHLIENKIIKRLLYRQTAAKRLINTGLTLKSISRLIHFKCLRKCQWEAPSRHVVKKRLQATPTG